MGIPYTVTLDIRNWKSNDRGWKSVKSSTGSDYSYLYAGGSDGDGNVTEKIGTPADVTVNLVCDGRYHILALGYKNDPKKQLSTQSQDLRSAVILDKNDQQQKDAYFSVVITDTGNGNCTFDCDPKISNDP